jgi:release factor glutamine methyltransferase
MMADLRGASIAQARRALAADLRRAGIESPELDARVLLGCALGLDHTGLVNAAAQQLSDLSACAVERLIARRIAGEPVARIVGQKEFWGLPFAVTPAVLVPRPETETVVELALALIDQGGPRTRALDILDLAIGSGAILLALLSELPQSRGLGTDIDPDALSVARLNANRLTLAQRARFAEGDFGAGLDGAFDLVVSNPPYIAAAEIAGLAR